jgi:hypothetical protein
MLHKSDRWNWVNPLVHALKFSLGLNQEKQLLFEATSAYGPAKPCELEAKNKWA